MHAARMIEIEVQYQYQSTSHRKQLNEDTVIGNEDILCRTTAILYISVGVKSPSVLTVYV